MGGFKGAKKTRIVWVVFLELKKKTNNQNRFGVKRANFDGRWELLYDNIE